MRRQPYILVVDDDATIATLICEHLEHFGYRVTYCTDAAQAIIQAQSVKLGLLIADIMMPVFGSGVDAYRRIRANPRLPKDLPIIFLTGLTPEQAQRMVPKDDPRVRLLHKPLPLSKLITAIKDLTGETLAAPPPAKQVKK
ncbi:MAG: response regulator [Elusimicrobiota bacterium]